MPAHGAPGQDNRRCTDALEQGRIVQEGVMSRRPAPLTQALPGLTRPIEIAAASPEAVRPVRVILPFYNEAGCARRVVDEVARFAQRHPEYRFLMVDDGSSDGTRAILEEGIRGHAAASPGLDARMTVTGYRINAGKGYAVLRGVSALEGGEDDDPVIFTDGDLAYSLGLLPQMARALESADVAIGSRRGPQGGYRAHPLRNAMGLAYNRMARVCLGASYRDTQAGLKGFRLGAARRIFAALRVTGFAFDVEALYLARRFGYRIAEVAVRVRASHRAKPSEVSLLRDPRRMFISLAGIRVSGALGQYERPEQGRRPLALLSFDAEEFDAPNEFSRLIGPEEQMTVGAEGMRRALDLLDEVPARATFFTTAAFAQARPELVREAAARGHEIASHGMTHTGFQHEDPERSRRTLEEISGVRVRGFRRARFAATDPMLIRGAGYDYDSSINPIWMPGRYNRLRSPRRAHALGDLVEIPVSATPLVRFPLFWLAFKNSPGWMIRVATRWALAADGYAALCFHPWELCDLSGSGLPWYMTRLQGASMQSRLVRYLRWLSRRATFATYSDLEGRFRAGRWPFAGAADSVGNPKA
jgi:peptidoglycan/xylan/chitin deacetylase (PgdA/CDA1 family)